MNLKEAGRKRIVYNNRRSVRIIVIVYVLIHIAFAATSLLPDRNKYSFSAFREPVSLTGSRSISLIRWDYSPDESTMELVFDFENSAYSNGGISFDAVYDGQKSLESEIVYQRDEMLIIQLYHIPEVTGKRVTVSFETKEDGNTRKVSFYTYTGIANEVASLPVLSEKEYYIQRQEYDIAYYEGLISAKIKAIQDKQTSIAQIEADNERLNNHDSKLTTDELLNMNETLRNNNSMIEALQVNITELQQEISRYENIIQVLKERIDDY